MIDVTTLNGQKLTVNAELIETIENMPETVIVLTTGKRLLVRETRKEVYESVIRYQRLIHQPLGTGSS